MDSLLGWLIRGVIPLISYKEVQRSPSSLHLALLAVTRTLADGANGGVHYYDQAVDFFTVLD